MTLSSAIITGADYATAMGTARSLRRMRVHRIGVCTDTTAICSRSKAWDRIVKTPDTSQGLIECLLDLGRELDQRAVLFPSSDEDVLLISEHREALGEYYDFVLPDTNMLDVLMKKGSFQQWASDEGFNLPKSQVVSSQNQLRAVLDEIQFPIIIKPFLKTETWLKFSPENKVLKLQSEQEMDSIGFDLFDAAEELLVQQWIPGKDTDVHFCLAYYDRQGVERAAYVGRKVLQWPLETGTAAVTVTNANPEMLELTRRFFNAANYSGLGSLETKFNPIDRKHYIIEATVGRVDLISPCSIPAGINMVEMAYCDAAGYELPQIGKYARQSIWINEYSLAAAIRRGGRISLRDAITLVFCPRKSFAYFSLRDPMPFIRLCGGMMRRVLRKAFSRIRRILPGTGSGQSETATG